MYLVSAIFVHLFGKYITKCEKVVVAEMMREAFVLSVIFVGTSMEMVTSEEKDLKEEVSKWII